MAAENRSISTPTAILIAGALIAAGLFFGLRSSGGPTAPGSPPDGTSAVSSTPPPQPLPDAATGTPAAPAQPAAASAPPSATTAAEVVVAAAKKELERHRAAMVQACVEQALANQPDPPKIKVTFNFSFDPSGKQVARGLSEDRATARAGVGACLSQKLPPISVPPPGASTHVEVPWELP